MYSLPRTSELLLKSEVTGADPGLEAFESNLNAIIQARELGKTAALVSNLCQKASDPQLVCVSSRDSAQGDSQCCTSSHGQSDSDYSPDVHEKSTEWKFKGPFHFAAGHWPAYDNAVR